MIEVVAGRVDGAAAAAPSTRRTGHRPAWGEVSLLTLAGLLALFLGLPVVVVVVRSLVDGSLAGAIASPAVMAGVAGSATRILLR